MASYAKKTKAALTLLYVIISLLILLIAFCAWQIYRSLDEYATGEKAYIDIANSYISDMPAENTAAVPEVQTVDENGVITNVVPIEQAASHAAAQASTQTAASAEAPSSGDAPVYASQKPNVNFAALKNDNQDTVAWIYSPNTVINYPVVQRDNEYYLTHLFDGSTNKLGTIFVDSRNTPGFVDQNTLIYGHNMKNGSMFASLHNYKSQSYYNVHPYYYLYVDGATYRVDIIGAYLTSTSDACFCTNFGSAETFDLFLQNVKAGSDIQTNVNVSAQDRIITLSTCHSSSSDARYVVLGKLVAE